MPQVQSLGRPWHIAIGAFVCTYLVSIPISLLGLSRYRYVINESSIAQAFNDYFVQRFGYFWLTVLYLSHMVFYSNQEWKIPSSVVLHFSRNYLISAVSFIVINEWFFGLPIFERVTKFSGGHCTGGGYTREHPCVAMGFKWIDGFDPSGHYFFTVSASLLLTAESLNTFHLDSRYERSKNVFLVIACGFLMAWYLSFLTTTLFFHTLAEKAVGLVVGLAVPLALYPVKFKQQRTISPV